MANADLREIYGLLRDIKADIASLKTENRIDHEAITEVEKRIDRVESVLDRAMGAKAIICLVASAIGAIIVAALQWLFARSAA